MTTGYHLKNLIGHLSGSLNIALRISGVLLLIHAILQNNL